MGFQLATWLGPQLLLILVNAIGLLVAAAGTCAVIVGLGAIRRRRHLRGRGRPGFD